MRNEPRNSGPRRFNVDIASDGSGRRRRGYNVVVMRIEAGTTLGTRLSYTRRIIIITVALPQINGVSRDRPPRVSAVGRS
jgi:hypothetical protein